MPITSVIAPAVSPMMAPGIEVAPSADPVTLAMPLRACANWSLMREVRSGPCGPKPFATA